MSQAKNKLQWCLNKAKREIEEGKKHRGLLKIDPDLHKASDHLTKAEHNLEVTLYLKKEDLDSVSTLDAAGVQEVSPTVVNIREEYQYGSKVSLEDNEYEQLLALAMKIMDKTKEYIL